MNAFCIHIYTYTREITTGNNTKMSQIFFELNIDSEDNSHNLKLSNIPKIIFHHFFSCFLSYRIINHNHKNSNQLTIQYNNQIHNKIWTIIIKLDNQIQKLKNISCQRNCLNFIIFLSIRLQSAENHKIKYNHKQTSNKVLNIVIKWPNHIGSHFILLWINQNNHAHAKKAIKRFLNFNFEENVMYNIGIIAHMIAANIIHRFCQDDSIDI